MKKSVSIHLAVFLLAVLGCGSAWALPWWNCDWHFRTELQITTTVSAVNRVVHLELKSSDFNSGYTFTPDGADVRVLDSDNATALDYHLEAWDPAARTAVMGVRIPALSAGSPRTVFVYYGNSTAANTSAVVDGSNPTSVFTQSGWRYHTRASNLDPTNAEQAFAEFENQSEGGPYGCSTFPTLQGRSNQNSFGSSSNFGLYAETLFEATTPGIWRFRVGIDFGFGGDFFIDHVAATNRWNDDLWWNFNWNNGDVLSGSYNLDAGYHHIEVLGFEGCCDGSISVEYLAPGSSTWLQLNSANLNLVSAGCPVGKQDFNFVRTSKPNRFGGKTFIDNGDNGTPYNALMEGNETGLAAVGVTVQIVGSTDSKSVASDANGDWQSCLLEEAANRNVLVTAATPTGHYNVSEGVSAVNSNTALNATLQFPVVGDNSYLDINTGYVKFPSLTQNNTIGVGAGLSGLLPHRYVPSSTADVSFQVSQLQHQQPDVFGYTVYQDLDCDGNLDSPAVPLFGSVATQVGQDVCLVIKVDGSAAVVESSLLELQVGATTDFSGIPLTHDNSNKDIVNGLPPVAMVLNKTVCNATQNACDLNTGAGFVENSVGKPNDELVYRLEFSSLTSTLHEVTLYDVIPGFTKLKPSSVSIVSQPQGMTCSVTSPIDQTQPGFTGTVAWGCSGSVQASQSGVVGFSVLVD